MAEKKKDIDEVIAEKNVEEKEAEKDRGGAEHRAQPSEEKKSDAIESITNDVPPSNEKVNLLDKLKDKVGMKTKPTATTTKKGEDAERVPEKKQTESEVVKQSKVRNKNKAREHAFNADGACVRCGAGNKEGSTTTHCFGRPLPRATAEKVREGVVDFIDGAWIKRKPCDDDVKDEKEQED